MVIGDPGQRASRERLGRRSETLAAWWLRARGYRIVGRRFRGVGGEIDIVARRGRLLAFVEVKARRTHAEALSAVTAWQLRRLARTAEEFLGRNPRYANCDLRFDVITLASRRLPVHLKDAWRPSDPGPQ